MRRPTIHERAELQQASVAIETIGCLLAKLGGEIDAAVTNVCFG